MASGQTARIAESVYVPVILHYDHTLNFVIRAASEAAGTCIPHQGIPGTMEVEATPLTWTWTRTALLVVVVVVVFDGPAKTSIDPQPMQ